MSTPEEKVANVITSGDPEKPTPGDCYDEDSGDFLALLTDGNGDELRLPPVNISIFVGGYWFVYKMSHKVEHQMIGEQDANKKEIKV